MPSSLHKTRKQIAKKRNGAPTALHEKSRDSLRLHKASVRDQRLARLSEARSKKEQPIRKSSQASTPQELSPETDLYSQWNGQHTSMRMSRKRTASL